MKIFAISDLHLSINNPKPMNIFGEVWDNYIDEIFDDWREKVTDDDIVLLAGDFSWAMKLEDTESDFKLLQNLPGKKILIRGNHDYWWKSISGVRGFMPSGFYAIQNDALKFGKYIICGTRGWAVNEEGVEQTEEDKKIFDREVIRLELTLQTAQKLKTSEDEEIICMIHYPPCNFHRQDSAFTTLLEKYGVKKVVYGHLHGYKKASLWFEKNGVEYFLTSCDMVGNRLTEISDWYQNKEKTILNWQERNYSVKYD